MKEAKTIAQRILSGYPDYGKAPDGYLLSVTEFIAYQVPEVQEALAHPLTGIATKCKFLPTIAEIKQFIEDRAKNLNTRATGYRYFKPGEGDPVEIPDFERRKAQVLAELGYDPAKAKVDQHKPLDAGTLKAIKEDRYSLKDLKSPSGPPGPELLAVLMEQGYLIPADREDDRSEQAA